MSYRTTTAPQCTCRAHSASLHFSFRRRLDLDESLSLPPEIAIKWFTPDLTTSLAWYASKKDDPGICEFLDKAVDRITMDMKFDELERMWIKIIVEGKKIPSTSRKNAGSSRINMYVAWKTMLNMDLEFVTTKLSHEERHSRWLERRKTEQSTLDVECAESFTPLIPLCISTVDRNELVLQTEDFPISDEPIAISDDKYPSTLHNKLKIEKYRFRYLRSVPISTFIIYAPPNSGKTTLQFSSSASHLMQNTSKLPFSRFPLILLTDDWRILRYESSYIAFLPSEKEFKSRLKKKGVPFDRSTYPTIISHLDKSRTYITEHRIGRYFHDKIYRMMLSGCKSQEVIAEVKV